MKMQQAVEVHVVGGIKARVRADVSAPKVGLDGVFCKPQRASLNQVPWQLILLLLLSVAPLHAQDEHKRKLPVIDKITSSNGQEAFTGSVQSLDLKTSLLLVHNTRDNSDEYFPVKKTVHVATADGQRATLDRLKPGASVLVYYEQKGDHRSVKEIVVLADPGQAPKEKSTPPS
jgi:hypothetical protein